MLNICLIGYRALKKWGWNGCRKRKCTVKCDYAKGKKKEKNTSVSVTNYYACA